MSTALSALLIFAAVNAMLRGFSLEASVTISGTTFVYAENFDTLPFPQGDQFPNAIGPDDWTNDGTVSGWTRALSNGRTDKDFYGVPSGEAGNTARFGNAGNADSNDRAIGAIAANSVSIAFGVVFEVGSNYEVTSVVLDYTGEQWFRTSANSPEDSLQFQYKVLNSYDAATFDINAEAGWTSVSALDFAAIKEGNNLKLNGNASANSSPVPLGESVSINFATAVNAGEFIVFRWFCDAPSDGNQSAGLFIDNFNARFTANDVGSPAPKVNVTSGPNFIIIVPDDHRWDATSFLQKRIAADYGRIARFPFLVDPDRTPNLDRLAREGLYFDNGFVVYSLCSPSRATMLTGVQPFVHGITANADEFDVNAVTYATLLQEAGWRTGYFGKWHMGRQTDRPGFEHVRTFYGQGSYFETAFYDENKTLVQTTGPRDSGGDDYNQWIDKVSTDYLLDYVDARYAADENFVAFLGFKTPHDPRLTDSVSNAPSSPDPALNFSSLFAGESPADVPNLLSQNGSAPIWKPNASGGSGGANTIAYLQLISAIDAQVGRVLAKLDELSLADNTVVIYISDNGYFRGEHGLGDKRAGYEESLRVPFMIRYPAIQPSGAGLSPTTKIGLNLDLAPTILDIAGLQVPEHMQGRSLKPLLEGSTPSDWRESFVFSYNDDPEYSSADPADMVGIRTESGYKLIRYAENSGWDELFDVRAAASSDDKYENNNYISDFSYATTLADLQSELERRLGQVGLIEVEAIDMDSRPFEMNFIGGDRYPFVVEKSSDLIDWTVTGTIEGSGEVIAIDLADEAPDSWDISVTGDTADYVVNYNADTSAVSAIQASNSILYLGSIKQGNAPNERNDGRDAVLVFELPQLPAEVSITAAQLEIHASRQFAQMDVDLWAIGIQSDTSPILEYHENEPIVGNVKLQDNLMDHMLDGLPTYTKVSSSMVSGLAAYLRDFYESTPGYSGGQYLFLRLNGDIDPRDFASQGQDGRNFRVTSGDDSSQPPKLHLSHTVPRNSNKEFYRVRYGIPIAP